RSGEPRVHDATPTLAGAHSDPAAQRSHDVSGCWAPEEVLPSAFYTGDIVRALRGRVGVGSGERGRRVVNARLS
ncbi:MAG: hypothetical protein AAFU79_36515, partial [Myxococcota bacterium]